jgi:hypothetical protein
MIWVVLEERRKEKKSKVGAMILNLEIVGESTIWTLGHRRSAFTPQFRGRDN